jgi:DNA-binding CsgD family transcriptional regulator
VHPFTLLDLPKAMAAFAEALDGFDRPDAPYVLLKAMNQVVPFQIAMSVVYHRNAGPIYVCDTFAEGQAKRALERYMTSTYMLNPVYNAFLAGLGSGVYRIRELIPDAYFDSSYYKNFEIRLRDDEELGYRTFGWPAGMEELVIAIKISDGELAEFSLSRLASKGGYSDSCVEDLRRFEPLIGAIFRRYWQHGRSERREVTRGLSLDHLFGEFGKDILSPREREVAQMILKGHSSESISGNLAISIATVKTHRQNLYAKLGVATQQELFSAFLRSMPAQPGTETGQIR